MFVGAVVVGVAVVACIAFLPRSSASFDTLILLPPPVLNPAKPVLVEEEDDDDDEEEEAVVVVVLLATGTKSNLFFA